MSHDAVARKRVPNSIVAGVAMDRRSSDLQLLKCAVLFVDLRGSTADMANPIISPETVADRMLALRETFQSIVSEKGVHKPDFLKSSGDGLMCVWHVSHGHNGSAESVRRQILSVALTLHEKMGERLKPGWNNVPPRIGIGLAYGDVSFVDEPGFRDYFGFTANLAAKLQDSARPQGLVVHDKYFEGLPEELWKKLDLKKQRVPSSSPLHRYGVSECFMTRDVVFTFDWTCLAWPGLAITDEIQGKLHRTRPAPVGLNTHGITVVTHEGLQGNIGTLEIWPRLVSREKGDRFELIIDDFDALAMMSRQSSINLVEKRRSSIKLNAALGLVSGSLVRAERHVRFLFIPIRCGVNALAGNAALRWIPQIRRYPQILEKIAAKEISPSAIGLYDNLGATMPILLMMTLGIDRHKVYSVGEQHLNSCFKKLRRLTRKQKFQRYVRIDELAHDLQSGQISLVPGGGAWLGSPNHCDEPCRLDFHIPHQDGGFLWVEGAAVTADGDWEEAESLLEFLTSTVLDETYQWGLANGRPYGSSPVRATTISRIHSLIRQKKLTMDYIDAETNRIYKEPQTLNSLLRHRECPTHFPSWLEYWNRIVTECCE